MGIKVYKPITNGRRDMTTLTNSEITKSAPEKSLTVSVKKTGGRTGARMDGKILRKSRSLIKTFGRN